MRREQEMMPLSLMFKVALLKRSEMDRVAIVRLQFGAIDYSIFTNDELHKKYEAIKIAFARELIN